MVKNSLPPGFRFHPTDVELVKYYLKRKVLGKKLSSQPIVEVDIYKHAPWDLPRISGLNTGDLKWFFYSPIEKKYASGARVNRATSYGFWKTTGKDKPIKNNGEIVGMRKTLVFHRGKPPRGERTDWVMHEYRLEEKDLADRGIDQGTYVLCAIFEKDGVGPKSSAQYGAPFKDGVGPKSSAQYGAPFKDEDWIDDDDATLPTTSSPSDMPMLAVAGASSSSSTGDLSVEPHGFDILPPMVNTNVTYAAAAPKCLDPPPVSVVADLKAVPMVAVHALEGPEVPVFADHSSLETHLLSEVPQIEESCDELFSWMDFLADDDALLTHNTSKMTRNGNDSFFTVPQLSGGDEDILFLLESFTENNSLNYLFE